MGGELHRQFVLGDPRRTSIVRIPDRPARMAVPGVGDRSRPGGRGSEAGDDDATCAAHGFCFVSVGCGVVSRMPWWHVGCPGAVRGARYGAVSAAIATLTGIRESGRCSVSPGTDWMKETASPTVLRFLTSSSGMRTPKLLLGVDDDRHHREGVDVEVIGEGLVELDVASVEAGLLVDDLGETLEDLLLAAAAMMLLLGVSSVVRSVTRRPVGRAGVSGQGKDDDLRGIHEAGAEADLQGEAAAWDLARRAASARSPAESRRRRCCRCRRCPERPGCRRAA
jgi:hypothetical protein